MPNYRPDKKNYGGYQKNKFSQKIKRPFISNHSKQRDEWIDDQIIECDKWMKISCKTDSPNCMPHLVRELEDIVSRYDNMANFKPINPIYSDGRLDFYLKVSRNESKLLYKNYSSIKRYDIKCMTFSDLHMPHVFPQDWINLIMQALDKRFSKNDATGETEVNLSDFSNDALMTEQGLLLRLSNTNVMKHVLNMFKDTNLKSITRLNLSNNDISNLFQLESFFEHCSVYCVDLSNNRLSRLSDLKFMSKNEVIDLNITKNDFTRKMSHKQLQEEIRKIIPRLTILNGKPLPASVIVAGDTISTRKSLPETVFSDKKSDVYTQFVLKYCAAFDCNVRDALCEFYSADSVMSLDCYTSEMPYCYRSLNSNIYMARKDGDDHVHTYKRGKAAIVGAFASFPKTRHIEETLNVDIVFRTDTDIMFILTGTFLELPEKGSRTYRPRQFSRTFVFHKGVVLQDHISLMPTDSDLCQKFKPIIDKVKEQYEFPERYKEELKGIGADAIEIVRQFKIHTGMTVKACLEFLSFVNNLQEAMEKFGAMKEQGTIPQEAYDTK